MPHLSMRRLGCTVFLVLALFVAGSARAAEKVTIAASQTAILVWLAEERGYFADEGLDIEIRMYQSGSYSADAVIKGEVALSTSSEAAFVSRSLVHPNLRVLATISASETARLVGRRDHGIVKASDLPGKRIGVTRKSTAEFFLGRYLIFNGIAPSAVKIVDLKPSEIAAALASGEIDAGVTWDPYMYRAEVKLGERAVSLPNQYGQFFYFVLMGRAGWIEANAETVQAILRALLRAETFAIENEAAARTAIRRKFDYEQKYIDHFWPLHSLRVGLPQDLLLVLEEQAKWRIRQHMTDRQSIPNFLDFIASGPLGETKPSAVDIVQ